MLGTRVMVSVILATLAVAVPRAAYRLWFALYNYCRVHHTPRVTPAMRVAPSPSGEAVSRLECPGA
jgi:hypothetical protein